MALEILKALGIHREMIAARGLRRYEEADQRLLETVALADGGREYRLLPDAAASWRSMYSAAQTDQVELIVLSAFRSIERQAELVRDKLNMGMSIGEVMRSIAPPGYSEHHTGRALDIASLTHPLLEVSFAETIEFAWLAKNARRFGFLMSYPKDNALGYLYEPWHWCWHPK
jgi:zinc D-Ala-D-Ala carboxypeptidase